MGKEMKFESQKWALLLGVFLTVSGVTGQIDTPHIPPEKDFGDLFLRTSRSQIVIVGKVVRAGGVTKRLSESETQARFKEKPTNGKREKSYQVSLDGLLGGPLFEVVVEETVCRAEYFDPKAPPSQRGASGKRITLFVPRDEPQWKDGNQKEYLFEGKHYLLFLERVSSDKQRELTGTFQLDPKGVYHRGHQRARGVVPLGNLAPSDSKIKPPSVLETVRRLCDAARPARVSDKITALKKLTASGDPVLVREANLAMEALKSRPATKQAK